MYLCTYVCVYACMRAWMHGCMHARMYIVKCVYLLRVHMFMHVHVCGSLCAEPCICWPAPLLLN